jgi:CelD/BcsL family acetyltransferase involved in cellulose biosynthesis
VQITVYDDVQVFSTLHEEWSTLAEHTFNPLIFLSWEWQSAWWDAYAPGSLFVITCRDNAGQLIGIAPWFIETRSPDERIVRTIGCVDVTDYLDILALEAHLSEVTEAFTQTLLAHRDRWDRVSFCNIPAHSPSLPLLVDQLTRNRFSVQVAEQEVCPRIALPDTFENYLESLDKKQRHELRRKLRRIEAENTSHMCITQPEQLRPHIEQFIALMRASHPDKAAFLDDPSHDRFFRAVLPRLASRGWLHLTLLYIEDVPCAAYCHFDYLGELLVYNSGLDPLKNAHLSPGIVLLCLDIRWAIEHGRRGFDFLRGNEEYKYRMGGIDHPVMRLQAAPAIS